MAAVDVLSDDDDEQVPGPAIAAPCAAVQEACVPAVPPAVAPVQVSADLLLSDSEDELGGKAAEAAPPAPVAAPPAAPQEAEPAPKPGLRSVVIAHMALDDSDDEPAAAPAALAPIATAPAPPEPASTPAPLPQPATALDDSEDEPMVPAATSVAPVAVAPVPHAIQAPLDDSEDEPMVASVPAVVSAAPPPPAQAAAALEEDSEDEPMAPAAPAAPAAAPAAATAPPTDSSATPAPPVPDAQKPKAASEAAAKPGTKRAGASTAAQAPAGKAAKADGKAEGKEKKMTKEEMEKTVFDYMQQQNRPYNVQNVFDNLHGAVPKSQVQQLLDALADSGRIAAKVYGKIKVYLVTQAAPASAEVANEEAKQLQASIDEKEGEVKSAKASTEEVRRSLSSLRGRISAKEDVERLLAEARDLELRLAQHQESAATNETKADEIDAQEIERVEAALRKGVDHWRRRKRLCMEMLRTFSESAEMKVEALIDKYGVDTDEACDQNLTDIKIDACRK
eukprot:TRINITY_DN41360_c0_g1_i1.p1 TRINITY_DN41360_c0_g1~~TRINITY_DN41360_c0_g1_i1.p1  ORF type:complete len:535 (+),score=140.89 TRINITY_DN41360_c0_g1_i1:84-1607(+)